MSNVLANNQHSRFKHFTLPQKAGAGFKTLHADHILDDEYKIGFLEVHAENYMGAGGHPHRILTAMREQFPLSVHGVGLSIGAQKPLDRAHLDRLKAVIDRYEPGLVSEHLAWSTHDTGYFNDLLPVPYDRQTLERVVRHIDEVQTHLQRKILLENPSTYVAFAHSTMSEADFITEIATRSGCGLLLDVNNVHVSATNHGYSASRYLGEFPLQLVEEIHLAGHAQDLDDEGEILLIDAHDRPVADVVWGLYENVIAQTGPLPTLIEWDNDVPDWPVLKHEARLADVVLARHSKTFLMGKRHG